MQRIAAAVLLVAVSSATGATALEDMQQAFRQMGMCVGQADAATRYACYDRWVPAYFDAVRARDAERKASSAPPTSAPAASAAAPTGVQAKNEGHELLRSMSAEQREVALGKLLNASGEACTATTTFFEGLDRTGAAYWAVACSNGNSYVVAIKADAVGSTSIVDCAVLKLVGSECFKAFGQ